MITLRLNQHHKNLTSIQQIIQAIQKYPGCCDEVWLATEYGFPPLSVHHNSAEKMMIAAQKLRQAGIRVSLQLSNTIGHGPYIQRRDCSGLIRDNYPVQRMVGIDGQISDYCFCLNDKNFQNYTFALIKLYAAFHPDCVWIDDDLRIDNHGSVPYGCFCDNCLRMFREHSGIKLNRTELRKAFLYEDQNLCDAYVRFTRHSIAKFTQKLAQAVIQASPNSTLGYQYCHYSCESGGDMNHIFDALYEGSGHIPKSRPGGGFYCDHDPNGMLDKAMMISFANSRLPDYVKDIRPEIENTPDVIFGKSLYGTCLESSLYLSCGCNALTFATMMTEYEPISWHERMLEYFSRFRPFWEKIITHTKNTKQCGLCMYVPKTPHIQRLPYNESSEHWGKLYWNCSHPFLRLGISTYHNPDGACAYLLDSRTIDTMTDAEIQELLSLPVLTDGFALEKIANRGFGNQLSADAIPCNPISWDEEFLDSPINTFTAGTRWRKGTLRSDLKDHILTDKTGETVPICQYIRFTDNSPVGYSAALVSTQSDAQWAVFGYGLWDNILSFDKRNQLISAISAIANHPLPAVSNSQEQLLLLSHTGTNNRLRFVFLLHCALGKTEKLQIHLHTSAGNKFVVIRPEKPNYTPKIIPTQDGCMLSLPPLDSWETACILIS